MTFTIEHDKLTSGNFPKEELEKLEGITIDIHPTMSYTKQKVIITINEGLLGEGEDINTVIFDLGILCHSWCNINKYK